MRRPGFLPLSLSPILPIWLAHFNGTEELRSGPGLEPLADIGCQGFEFDVGSIQHALDGIA